MIGRLLRVTLWLMAAQVVLAGLYWALLSTPESNVWMLSLSALLVVALLLVAGVALDVAVRVWSGRPARPANVADVVRPGLRLVPALVVFGVVWWIASSAGASVEGSRGRITAAIMARTGWADPEILFTTMRWLVALVAWVAGPLLALGLFGALTRGDGIATAGRWLLHSLSWRALAAGAVVAATVAWFWPWLAAWRPALPPTWVQLVFVGAKVATGAGLLAIAVASYVGLAALDAGDPPRK